MRKLSLFAIAAATIIFSGLALISDRPVSAQRIKPNPPVVGSSCVSPPAGLVAWWPGDGNANDIVALNDGTLQGGATATGSGYVGSQAFSLSGTAQFVQVPDAPAIDVPTAVSLDAWVFATDLNKPIFAKAEGTNNWNSYGLWLTNGQLHFEVTNTNASSYGAWRTDAAILANTWYHVAATWQNLHGDSTDARLYLNGVEQTSVMTADLGYGPSFTLNYTNLPLVIGTDQAQTSFFNGLIDEVEIFNRVISSAEVASIYKAGNAGKCKPMCTPAPTGMFGWWGGDGNANDISGHGNNGTLQGGATFAVGKVGQAFDLNGTTAYIEVPDNPSLYPGAGSFTADAWIRTTPIAVNQQILAHYECGGTCPPGFKSDYEMLVNPGGQLTGVLRDSSSAAQSLVGTTTVTDGSFHHVVLVRDVANLQMRLYVDGLPDANAPLSVTGTIQDDDGEADPLTIGAYIQTGGAPAAFFGGLIDEVEYIGRALSPTEIRAIYRADVAGKCKRTCTPAPTNMVSWWDGEGNANDIHGTNHGTLVNGATFATGVVGQAFSFNGTTNGQGVLIGNPVSLQLQDFTIGAWTKRSSPNFTTSNDPLGAGGILSYGHFGYGFGMFGDGRLLLTKVDAVFVDSGSSPRVTDTNFHHVAVTKSGTSVVFYVDGVAGSPITDNATFEFTKNISIGARLDLTPPTTETIQTSTFAGLIDEVKVFNRALSPTEIQSIYNAGSVGECKHVCASAPANMVSWWPLDENAGAVANDIRGIPPNNGLLQGTVSFLPGEVAGAYQFDGTDADVKVFAAPTLDVGASNDGMTLDAWVNPANTSSPQPLFEWNNSLGSPGGSAGYGTHFWINTTNPQVTAGGPGDIFVNFFDGVSNHIVVSNPGLLTANGWQHVAATYDRSDGLHGYARILLNGTPLALNGTASTAVDLGVFTPVTNYDLYFGVRVSSNTPGEAGLRYAGAMDEVELFNRALTQPEIQSIYDAGSTGKCQTAPNRTFHIGDVTLTFGNINALGSFGVHPIAPGSVGQLPPGYNFLNPNSMAYDLTTTADYTGPIDICFHLPYITDPAALRQMTILHGIVTGTGTDWEEASPRAYNLATNSLCGRFNTLSPFAIVQGLTPTAAGAKISGFVTRSDGSPLGGVSMQLSGGRALQTITRSDGFYAFADLDTGNFYTVTPALANFTFSPRDRAFSLGGDQTKVGFTALPNTLATANPLDMELFFVRQQYLDFLGREPDANGLAFWTRQLSECGGDAACVHQRRLDVSAAFFASDEFRQTGSFIYRLYKAALGRQPTYAEFSSDRPQIVVGADLEASKDAFADGFMERAEFTRNFPSDLKPEAFVDSLITQVREASGVDLSAEAELLMIVYQTGASTNESRCHVMLAVIEDSTFQQAEYNQAFVLMQYFGYLHRDADRAGYDFWLDVLNNRVPGNYRAMVCSFVTSAEYQLRFGSVVTHSNAECGR